MFFNFRINSLLFLIISLTVTLNALSKSDKITKASLYPYVIKGITYYPFVPKIGENKEGLASWYGEYFHGRKTANGEIYNMYAYTAAHKTYPLGTLLFVTNPKNGKSLTVKINDRGPFWNDRELDLSMGAADFLGIKEAGVAKIKYRVVSVPAIVQSFVPIKGKVPLTPIYNVGYIAISYTTIDKRRKKSLFEIGGFKERKDAKKYLLKLNKYFPKAYIYKKNLNYKIKFTLSSQEELAIKKLKNLKKIGLITGYALCWSYD